MMDNQVLIEAESITEPIEDTSAPPQVVIKIHGIVLTVLCFVFGVICLIAYVGLLADHGFTKSYLKAGVSGIVAAAGVSLIWVGFHLWRNPKWESKDA